MNNIILIVVFIFVLVYIQLIHAHTADEIIDKHAEARGGKIKLNSIISVCMQGTRRMMGQDVSVQIIKVQGQLFRTDFYFDNSKGYIIVTPASGWLYIPVQTSVAVPILKDRLKAMQTELDIASAIIDYEDKGYKTTFAGKEEVDGKTAYKIKLSSAAAYIIYYIDVTTNLIVQTRQMRAGINDEDGKGEVIINYSDYRAVNGILFPYIINTLGTGPGAGFTAFDKIELNKEIDQSLYFPA